MIQSNEMLNFIHQNAEMGRDEITNLINRIDDEKFRNVLESQLQEYEDIFCSSKKLLNEKNYKIEGVTPVAKMSSHLLTNLKTMTDDSTSHIADMMIQGSTMGVNKLMQHINDYANDDKDILNLAKKELKTEQKNIDELKNFL